MKLNKKTVISLIPKAVLLILLLVIINTQLTESVVTGTFEKGLVFSILALGIFISFRILDIPDLSVDGTFTLGVAVSVMQAFNGDPIKGILLSIVAGGDNEYMVRASSINSDRMKIMGFAIANALVSLSGAMYAQYSSAGDSNSGTGMLVVGLASIIIGEIFFSKHSILCGILAAIFGAIAYRFVLAFAMNLGMDSNYTKLFSACIVALAISLPAIKKYITKACKRVCSDK